jgi:FkbH-like protein
MPDALLDYLSAGESDKARTFQTLKSYLKEQIALDPKNCAEVVKRATDVSLTYTNAVSLFRILKSLKELGNPGETTKIAFVSSFTTHQLCDIADLILFSFGIHAEIYEADYGLFRQEILDPSSGLYSFKPDFIYIATNWRDLLNRPSLPDTKENVRALVNEECQDWAQLWQTAFSRTGAQIIQNALDTPSWQQLGNHEMRHVASLNRYIAEVNFTLNDLAPEFVTLLDVDAMASTHGKKSWSDQRFFLQAKLPCAPNYLVDYAHNLASLIAAQKGFTRKCLVLDLDNTLWGGVIGDDGIGGIKLGQGDPESESFTYFQKYLKALKERGVILAVCSKNDDAIARDVFLNHAEMELSLNDISCFVANWNDKASNIRSIAKTLDIGLNSIVFIDDNPAERAIVRQLLPEVAVPELPIDPDGYIDAVDKHRFFPVVSVTGEDLKRTDFYKSNEARTSAQSSTSSINEFLTSLKMTAIVTDISAANLERCVQLINRSNQFNLTTKRYSNAEVLAISKSPEWVTFTVSLADRFGDNGLISVLLAKIEGKTLVIDTWLMSCRVLKRGVENFLLETILKFAHRQDLHQIHGDYIATAKNALVSDHYKNLGFHPRVQQAGTQSGWELAVPKELNPPSSFIHLLE